MEGGATVGNSGQGGAHSLQVVQPLIEVEVLETVAADLDAQKDREFFVHPH